MFLYEAAVLTFKIKTEGHQYKFCSIDGPKVLGSLGKKPQVNYRWLFTTFFRFDLTGEI